MKLNTYSREEKMPIIIVMNGKIERCVHITGINTLKVSEDCKEDCFNNSLYF